MDDIERAPETGDGIRRRDVLKMAGAAAVGAGALVAGTSQAMASVGFTTEPSAASGVGGDSGGTINFWSLAVGGTQLAVFGELGEIKMSVDQSGDGDGGSPHYDMVLKRGIAKLALELQDWFTAVVQGKPTARRNGTLVGFDASGTPVVRWQFQGALLVSILTTAIRSSGNDLVTEQATIVARSLVRIS